jgi:hypothetical protein
MQTALNLLGYSSYHSFCFLSSIRDSDIWNEALDAKFFGIGKPFTLEDWDQVLGHHSAVSADAPMVAFAEELITSYPDAKVILIEREIESWYTSFDNAVTSNLYSPFINLIADLDLRFMGRIIAPYRRWGRGHMRANNAEEMRRNARDVYKAHYELVRRITPKERLLEYKLGSGWGPLCEFLGKEVPDTPFPRVNDAQALNELVTVVVKKGIMNLVKQSAVYVVPVVLAGAGWYFASRVG